MPLPLRHRCLLLLTNKQTNKQTKRLPIPGVQYILDTVVENLLKDPTKRFSYTETAYFWKWWQQQPPEDQEKVRGLVASGQLEFVGGAWTMNDEATVNYQSVVDQFTYGLRYDLKKAERFVNYQEK